MKAASLLAGVALAAMTTAAAHATILLAGPSPEQATDTSFSLTYVSPVAGVTALSFTIDGYLTLDGQNFYEDDFTFKLNGATLFVGAFNLGGGTASGRQANVYANPLGASVANPTNNGTGVGGDGGQEVISFSGVSLNQGSNNLTFSYTSLADSQHQGFQGLGDEGWGVENVSVGAVPEVSSWAMMLLGFAGLGLAGYRRSPQRRLAAANV